MYIFNVEIYRPSDTEKQICELYKSHGIYSPADMDIEAIAAVFDYEIQMKPLKSRVVYDNNYCVFFLDSRLGTAARRADFFHELCHPLMHVGSQRWLPSSFVEYQEMQAAQFQMFAAMPYYLVAQYKPLPIWSDYYRMLAEEFVLPYSFVERRIKQMMARIAQERNDNNLRARFSGRSAVKVEYMQTTLDALDRLNEIKRRKGAAGR